jgi:tripartite motif-containing protein 71
LTVYFFGRQKYTNVLGLQLYVLGTGNGQFIDPGVIIVDSEGNTYVTDQGNNRVQKFDSDGNFVTKWGSEGSGEGQFNSPLGISLDFEGNVYVVDTGN